MRLFIVSLIILFLLIPQSTYALAETDISAEKAVLIEFESGRVLFNKNAELESLVASITKIMTAIIAIEHVDLSEKVVIKQELLSVEGSSIYLQPDEEMTMEELLYGLMLRSGNDAAMVIADYVGGSVEGFVYLMNEKARYLGLKNTSFKNPHGLDEENHYSSAADIAQLMRYAQQNDIFAKISNTSSYLSENRDYYWFNKNKLLTSLCSFCIGGKTGFTKKAGRTLVSIAEKDDIKLIAVTLNASNDWQDHLKLYETYFSELQSIKLLDEGKITLLSDQELFNGFVEEDVAITLNNNEKKSLQTAITIGEKDERVITYYLNEQAIVSIPVQEYKVHFTDFIKLFLRISEHG